MLRYFSASAVREIEDGDVIGDHTESHPMLAHLSPPDAQPQGSPLQTARPRRTARAAAPRVFPPAVWVLQREHDPRAARAAPAEGAVVGGHERLRAARGLHDRRTGARR